MCNVILLQISSWIRIVHNNSKNEMFLNDIKIDKIDS